MDLIYTDKNGIDVDMLPTYKLDMAYGRDENNFEVTIAIEDHCCEPECRIYTGAPVVMPMARLGSYVRNG